MMRHVSSSNPIRPRSFRMRLEEAWPSSMLGAATDQKALTSKASSSESACSSKHRASRSRTAGARSTRIRAGSEVQCKSMANLYSIWERGRKRSNLIYQPLLTTQCIRLLCCWCYNILSRSKFRDMRQASSCIAWLRV
jgi:hypothetical protein